MPWAARTSRPIPSNGSRRAVVEINDFSLGMNSFVSNDKFPLKNGDANMWRLAQDARIPTLGEYETRKGFDYLSDAVGETIDVQQTSTTGADDQDIGVTVWAAKKITFTTSGRCTRLDVNLKNPGGATGAVMVELYSDVSSAPGALLGRSSVAGGDIGDSYAYKFARMAEPPLVSAGDYWVVARIQLGGSGTYQISSTTNASTGLTSSNSGNTWDAASVDFNVKAYLSTDAPVKGLYQANKSDGTSVTLVAVGTVLYSVNEVTGALTTVKSGLSASATHYEFEVANDVVYYVNGFDGYRKWDFTTESQVNSTNYTHIRLHKGLMFLREKDDPNKVAFSNFGDYETFTSTDFVYVPAPKTGDPTTALISLNGYLLIFTRNNKFILSGDDNATFVLDEAPDQKGTYSQQTVAQDKNFVYYLSDDGFYRSNGSEAQLMSEGAYDGIINLPQKQKACVVINRGRVYLWHHAPGGTYNSECYVWNLNFGRGDTDCLESHDTNAFVARAVTAFNDDDRLIVASSIVGQVYYQELESNDYTNLGGDLNFTLQTHYMTFGSPASLKQIRKWRPRFAAQSGDYAITAEYATDLRDNWATYGTPNVQGEGPIWGAFTWGSATWGTTAEIYQSFYVPGEYRRTALRYRHTATRQPQKFLGHSLEVQIRRMR